MVNVFNEALARELVKDFLLRHEFRAARAKLDEYYNIQEESGLITYYLSNVKYVPIPGSTLEKFIGEINKLFSQLGFAGNPVNDVNKLDLIRSAIKKGSKKYKETLKLCVFAGKSYQEILDKLHDQCKTKYSMFQYSESHSKNEENKRRNEDESLTITATNNNNSNSNKSNKFPGYCNYCGKCGHKALF